MNEVRKINNTNILIVEDDELIRMELSRELSQYGQVFAAGEREETYHYIEKNSFDLAFIDLEINKELLGFKILEDCKKKNPNIFTVIISSYASEKDFVRKCYKLGCREFLVKPHTEQGLKIIMNKFIGQKNSLKIKEKIRTPYITQDPKTIESLEMIENIYHLTTPVFISGPSGTGKQVVSEIIHDLGHPTRKNFISINCSEFNDSLLESELFGHVKGAFTGADKNKIGRLKLADGGTLFLDEIGTMPISMQNKLIKAIEEKCFVPVGGQTTVQSNFRLIAATSSDLYEQVGLGKFRLDFLYRINSTHIKLYPLSERKNDINFLINYYIEKLPSGRAISISDEAMAILKKYSWYGNVRELKALVDKWDQNGIWEVTEDSLPQQIVKNINPFKKNELEFITKGQINKIGEIGLRAYKERMFREVIEYFFEKNDRKTNLTITKLGIPNKTFYKYISPKK